MTIGSLGPSVQAGYVAVNTDAGHPFTDDLFKSAVDASWIQPSPGVLDWNALQNFAAQALDDMVHIGKAITTNYYGQAPKYSYWNGCSTGGRQGMMQAQRFPKNFDGILAMAPAFNWDSFLIAEFWPFIAMKREGYYPPACEMMAIQKAAIEACDELDGVKDGVVAAQGLCDFDAATVVGRKFDCEGDERKISKSAAKIANAVWEGAYLHTTWTHSTRAMLILSRPNPPNAPRMVRPRPRGRHRDARRSNGTWTDDLRRQEQELQARAFPYRRLVFEVFHP